MLKLKIPPVVVAIAAAISMKLLERWFPGVGFVSQHHSTLALLIFLMGTILGVASVIEFLRKSTSLNPHKPQKATALVNKGVYKFSRNPMYLALLLLLVSWAVYLANFLAFLVLPVFVWYMNEFQIKPEEETMGEKFGAEYGVYRENVRRWI